MNEYGRFHKADSSTFSMLLTIGLRTKHKAIFQWEAATGLSTFAHPEPDAVRTGALVQSYAVRMVKKECLILRPWSGLQKAVQM